MHLKRVVAVANSISIVFEERKKKRTSPFFISPSLEKKSESNKPRFIFRVNLFFCGVNLRIAFDQAG